MYWNIPVYIFVLKEGGGLASIDAGLAANLPDVYDDIFSKYTPGGLLSYWILVGFGTLGLPQTAVRAMGFKDTKSMHKAMWIGVLTCSFVIIGMHLAGTWAGALVDTDNLPTSDYLSHISCRRSCRRELQQSSLLHRWQLLCRPQIPF